MDSDTKLVELQVKLLDEGTNVSRTTRALEVGEGLFKILPTPDYDPEDELWEFVPGKIVRLQRRRDGNGEYFLAVIP